MKLGIALLLIVLVLSIAANLVFFWKSIDLVISKDHMRVEIDRCHKREETLLRLSRALSASMSNDTLKAYIRSNMRDLDISEQGEQFIVNGVEIRFDTTPPSIN